MKCHKWFINFGLVRTFGLFQYYTEILEHFWVNKKMLKIRLGTFKIL